MTTTHYVPLTSDPKLEKLAAGPACQSLLMENGLFPCQECEEAQNGKSCAVLSEFLSGRGQNHPLPALRLFSQGKRWLWRFSLNVTLFYWFTLCNFLVDSPSIIMVRDRAENSVVGFRGSSTLTANHTTLCAPVMQSACESPEVLRKQHLSSICRTYRLY